MKNRKVLCLMRGIPGSGKSFFAKAMKDNYLIEGYTCAIYSTDDFWLTCDGGYAFDPALLGEAHQWNKARVRRDTKSDIVVVDNTNIRLKEILPYLEIAAEHDRDVMIMESPTTWAWDVDECFKRNTHGVPRETIQRMKDRYQRIKAKP